MTNRINKQFANIFLNIAYNFYPYLEKNLHIIFTVYISNNL